MKKIVALAVLLCMFFAVSSCSSENVYGINGDGFWENEWMGLRFEAVEGISMSPEVYLSSDSLLRNLWRLYYPKNIDDYLLVDAFVDSNLKVEMNAFDREGKDSVIVIIEKRTDNMRENITAEERGRRLLANFEKYSADEVSVIFDEDYVFNGVAFERYDIIGQGTTFLYKFKSDYLVTIVFQYDNGGSMDEMASLFSKYA